VLAPALTAEEDSMQSLWRTFWSDDSGQGLVEVALIIALIGISLIAIMLSLRNGVGHAVNGAATQLDGHPTASP
jgi:Flp pilus assembly pilin Flp